MKEYQARNIRNVGLVAHGEVGKTSLAEAMLYSAGESNRLGRVDEGTTMSDYTQEEIERRISISLSLLHCFWKDHKFNILDTPGYFDFIGEVKAVLRVVDSAVVLLNALAGVEVGTETVCRFAEQYGLPRIFFVNKLDKEHADFNSVLKATRERFGNSVVVLQFPVNQGEGFDSIIDLIKMKLLRFELNDSGKYIESDIPNHLKDKAQELRINLEETIAENDEELLEVFCNKGQLSEEEFKRGLRKAITKNNLFPVLCGAATKNIGTHRLLDILMEFAPSPLDRPDAVGIKPNSTEKISRKVDNNEPLSALVFKTISEPHVGELSFFRVYSGVMKSGLEVLNANQGATEKIGQIFLMNGKNRKEIGYTNAGDLGAIVKLKVTHTGDTLCDRRAPILLEGIDFPEPVIRIAVEPKSKGDEEKISAGLTALHDEDPTVMVTVDSELRQTIISGQGELHLDIVVKKLKDKFGVDVNLVEPKIPYRETLRATKEAQGKYKKQSGGRGQYGDIWLRLEPLPRGSGFEFVDAIVGGVVPSKYIPAVEKGIREAMNEGVIAGYPVTDVRVTLYDGTYHSVDSSDLAFKIAGSLGFKKAFREAKPILLEPIYDVEVIVPEEYMGDVMGDISSRRGKILGMEAEGSFQVIKAKVPLAELYKYSTTLRSLTQGRGLHRRKFSHYEEVPQEIADKIITASQQEKK